MQNLQNKAAKIIGKYVKNDKDTCICFKSLRLLNVEKIRAIKRRNLCLIMCVILSLKLLMSFTVPEVLFMSMIQEDVITW